MKRFAWLAGAMGGLVVCWLVSLSSASEGAKHSAEAEFAPKVLMIYCKDPQKGAVLADVRIQQLGGRGFLRGKVLSRDGAESAWTKATQWILIEDVVEMFEFDNVEQARAAWEEAQKKEGKP
jgi:hypothetical protein